MTSHDLPVGEVAHLFGLRDSALRFYERRGLLHPPRDAKGHRRYREQDLRDLAFILMCRDGGLQLEEISVLMGHASADGGRWQDIVEERIVSIDVEMTRLRAGRAFLSQARQCTSEHPAVECPYALPILERIIAGTAQRDG